RDAHDRAAMEAICRRGLDVFEHLARLPVPAVAIIHGVCLGGGLELALACRQRLALSGEPDVRLGTPEVRLGLIPGWGAIAALPRLIGLSPALRLLLTGEPIGADDARQLGLVDE